MSGGTVLERHVSLAAHSLLVLEFYKVQRITFVEQNRTKHRVHLSVSPMLAQDISRVDVTTNVVELNHLGRHSFARVVVGQSMVSLGESRVGNGPTLNH